MEEGKPLSPPLEMVFSDVVEEEAQSFRGPALAKGRSLRLDITPMLTLQGDEGAVRQLVSILVDNAVKYAPDGGENPCMTRLATQKNPRALSPGVSGSLLLEGTLQLVGTNYADAAFLQGETSALLRCSSSPNQTHCVGL